MKGWSFVFKKDVMENKRVLFDGKNLSFDVDGVRVVNGKMPESFEINEEYIIDKESLAKLVAVLSEGITILKKETQISLKKFSYLSDMKFIVYCGNSGESKMLELAEELYKENKVLFEEGRRRLEADDKYHTEVCRLNDLIDRHNNSNIFSRMREIRKEE